MLTNLSTNQEQAKLIRKRSRISKDKENSREHGNNTKQKQEKSPLNNRQMFAE